MDTWEERMAARVPPPPAGNGRPCASDDGNEAVGDTALCHECLTRPYGTLGPERESSRCDACWAPRLVWIGNTWAIRHRPGSLFDCDHPCHDDEVWMA